MTLAEKQQTDRLGKLADVATGILNDFDHDFVRFARFSRGRECLADTSNLDHPAGPWINQLRRHGMPVVLKTPPWSLEQRDAAVQYGSHSSAEAHRDFLRDELADMVEAGHWVVLPYSAVRNAQDLRISPLGVVPQRDRRPRPIVDYTYTGINPETQKLAPPESMQFGKALDRIIDKAARADPAHGPIHLSKYDLADAFMRVSLSPATILRLAVAVPVLPGEEPLVAVPLVLLMGWLESPPTFCTVTETIADLANKKIVSGYLPKPQHRHEALANTRPNISPTTALPQAGVVDILQQVPVIKRPNQKTPPPATLGPLEHVDVFMDDFILSTQGPMERQLAVRRILLECLDLVIRPLDNSDRRERKEAASLKKLQKGDGCLLTVKTILGWLLDMVQRTIQLPASRIT
jgi:hypothetical protein